MNQILSIDNSSSKKVKNEKPKKSHPKNNGPIEIISILKFFSIALLLYGIFMVGSGTYSMYKELSSENATKPIINIEQTGENTLVINITHDKPLAKATYKWNEEEEVEISFEGNQSEEKTLTIPKGTNALAIHATDINGQESEYRKVYTIDETIQIEVQAEGNGLKVNAEGVNELSYMTYRWGEDEETKIDINDKTFETNIEIPKGLNKLTIIVVDEKNETKTFEQEVNGVTKPQVEVTTDGVNNFIIKASDEQGIKRVEFIIDEEEKYLLDLERILPVEERKEFEYSYPLHEGENKIEVTVYNEDDISETFRALANM